MLDLLAKKWCLQHLYFEETVPLVPSVNLLLTINHGAAFSLFNQAGGWQVWLFGLVATIVIVVIVTELLFVKKKIVVELALSLILSGTIGNFHDRLLYRGVIDFIDLYWNRWHYPTFNLADAMICSGLILGIISALRQEKIITLIDGNRPKKS
jgi:lipoprotein signal peptidase